MTEFKKIKRIGIVGLGLIGGSLAKILKKNNYGIVGITKNPLTIDRALADGVIDKGFTEITKESVKGLDLIFLAGPLNTIPHHMKIISDLVTDQIILSDVGSTKEEICEVAKSILPSNISFVGGHPMAGTEKAGYVASNENLLNQCAWILTPIDDSQESKNTIKLLGELINEIGAKPIIATPEHHDKAVALISHLPLLVSIGLCQVVKDLNDIQLQSLASMMAASGFRDMTRIGAGNPEMNSNLLISNLTEVANALPRYKQELDKIMRLAIDEPERLLKITKDIQLWRSKLYNDAGKNSMLIEN